jgi:3-oxoacyl-[acyl-carrier-protein] synthase I
MPGPSRRVVVTGMGILSCIGNDLAEVVDALYAGRSGIRHAAHFEAAGMRSQVVGLPILHREPAVERKARRFMGEIAIYAHHAMRRAVSHSGLSPAMVESPRTGLIVGSGTGSLSRHAESMETFRDTGIRRVPPYTVFQSMGSTASAILASEFNVRGRSYGIAAACASSAHAIGQAGELIQAGKQDIVFAGGAEEAEWTTAVPFDAMGALSTGFNSTPENASRPFEAQRDGFVLAGGAAVLVLEALDHATARGARIHGELTGYGTSSGGDIAATAAAGAADAMREALAQAGVRTVDYVNAHATSTAGDVAELRAIREALDGPLPPISSTKGLTGHSLGAAGAHEAIYSLLMMQEGFVAACHNLDEPDAGAKGYPLVRSRSEGRLDNVLSNSFGFGGTNAALVFSRYRGGGS